MRVQQLRFQQNVAALTGVVLGDNSPFKGYISEVTIHWPLGCAALVDVRVGHGPNWFCPTDLYLAMDNATPTFHFREPVSEGERVLVEMINNDGVNPHSITVVVTVVEAEEVTE